MAVGDPGGTSRPDQGETGWDWGEAGGTALKGAAGGAVTGAAIGSGLGPLGTAAGGGVGAVAGALGGLAAYGLNQRSELPVGVGQYDPNAQNFYGESGDMLNYAGSNMGINSAWQNRGGDTMSAAQGYGRDQQQMRGQQLDYISQLQGMAAGTSGPSAAEQIVQSQREKSVSQAAALAASGHGMSPALAMKQAQEQAGQAGQAASQQAATIRSQEQLAAIGQLGGAISGARGQDQNWAMDNAAMRQQGQLANLDASMQQRQMNDQMTQQFMDMGLSIEEARMQAGIELEKIRAEQQQQMNEMLMEQEQSRLDRRNKMIGGIASGGASAVVGALSDETAKKDIKTEPGKIDKFMDELGSYSYKYKDEVEDVPKTTRFGIMAQELERSEVGSTFVKETSQGKAIDVVQSVGPILASLSRLNNRQKQLEKILKKGSK